MGKGGTRGKMRGRREEGKGQGGEEGGCCRVAWVRGQNLQKHTLTFTRDFVSKLKIVCFVTAQYFMPIYTHMYMYNVM